tara:strand:+ start:1403 stop:1900 length:498 start_codon:yes stop_codon:yes gene_type:complete
MARPANRYTNPETGETKTTKGWCSALNISDTELQRRIKRHGLSAKVFVRKAPTQPHKEWQEYERDFIKECLNSGDWTISEVAKKLERSFYSVDCEAKRLGKTGKAPRRPSLNWMYIWEMRKEGLTKNAIARVMRTSRAAVRHALTKMDEMDESERLAFFSRCGYF